MMLMFFIQFKMSFSGSWYSSEMNWKLEVDEATKEDACMTWQTHFQATKPEVTKQKCLEALEYGSYENIPIKSYLKMNVENQSRISRYPNAKTAEEFYPPNDRPRGVQGISSISNLFNTKNYVNPIIVE